MEEIKPKLDIIRNNLAIKSHEMINKADEIVAEALERDKDSIDPYKATLISDVYSKRFARLTGIEVGGENTKPNILNIIHIDRAIAEKNNAPKQVIDVDPT